MDSSEVKLTANSFTNKKLKKTHKKIDYSLDLSFQQDLRIVFCPKNSKVVHSLMHNQPEIKSTLYQHQLSFCSKFSLV